MSNQTNGKSMQKPWQSGHNIQSQVLLPDGILLNTGSRFFRLNTGPRCQGQRHFRTPAHTFAITLLTVLAIFLLGLLRPAAAETATSGARLEIFASILPQKFFIEKLAGDLANVEVMVGPGMSPHTYEPLPQQMSRISRARLFFTIGVPFEKTLEKKLQAVCPNLKIVATNRNVEYRMMESSDQTHVHSESCTHGHGEPDPHIWLDPHQVMIQAGSIAEALKENLPEHRSEIEARLASFTAELQRLSDELATILAPVKGQTMLVFHPAFGYFADRYGLKQLAIEIEGKEPGPRQLAELIRKCRNENIHLIFVQQQFPVAAANTVAEAISGAVVPIDPLAEDYFNNLRHIAGAVSEGLTKK